MEKPGLFLAGSFTGWRKDFEWISEMNFRLIFPEKDNDQTSMGSMVYTSLQNIKSLKENSKGKLLAYYSGEKPYSVGTTVEMGMAHGYDVPIYLIDEHPENEKSGFLHRFSDRTFGSREKFFEKKDLLNYEYNEPLRKPVPRKYDFFIAGDTYWLKRIPKPNSELTYTYFEGNENDFERIEQSRYVIAHFPLNKRRDPRVLFEIGFANAVGTSVILLDEHKCAYPFLTGCVKRYFHEREPASFYLNNLKSTSQEDEFAGTYKYLRKFGSH